MMKPETNESITIITVSETTENTMSSADVHRSRWVILCTLLVVGLTVLSLPIMIGSVTAPPAQGNSSNTTSTPTATNTPAKNTQTKNTPAKKTSTANSTTHTLVVKTAGKPVSYVVHASRKIDGETAEGDTIQGTSLTGHLGGPPGKNSSNDTKDVIKYQGHIETFQHRGKDMRLFLNGQRVSPSVLADNHVTISRQNATGANKQPIHYRINVSGRAILGESTEKQDTINVTRNGKTNHTVIRGRITNNIDSFYFTGNVASASIDKSANVKLNGKSVSNLTKMSNKKVKKTPAPTVTPTPGTSPSTSGPRSKTTGATGTEIRVGPNMGTDTEAGSGRGTSVPSPGTAANGNDASSDSSSSSALSFLLSIVGGLFVIGTLVVAAVWYLRPRQRRW